jgi:hypothetical protein
VRQQVLNPTRYCDSKQDHLTVLSGYVDLPPTLPFATPAKSRPILHTSASRLPFQRFLAEAFSSVDRVTLRTHNSRNTGVGIITSSRKVAQDAQAAPVRLAHRTCSTPPSLPGLRTVPLKDLIHKCFAARHRSLGQVRHPILNRFELTATSPSRPGGPSNKPSLPPELRCLALANCIDAPALVTLVEATTAPGGQSTEDPLNTTMAGAATSPGSGRIHDFGDGCDASGFHLCLHCCFGDFCAMTEDPPVRFPGGKPAGRDDSRSLWKGGDHAGKTDQSSFDSPNCWDR